ncbi:MAG: glycosyltransferase family 2 protein [Syntrophobacteraceae bacterium]
MSICIPTYNRASYLKGVVENIFSELEEYDNAGEVQIVIVDGKSQDNTTEVVDTLKAKAGAEIKYYRRDRKVGIDRDILKCIEIADGKYCWLFSDDDAFPAGAINHLVEILKKNVDLTGCFCNRKSYDFSLRKEIAEAGAWAGKLIEGDRLFTDKAECFKCLGMDLGFISSQVVSRSRWQEAVEGADFKDLYSSYYLMVHVIAEMMNSSFKWMYIDRPLVMQRTANDSLLLRRGVMDRHNVEHNSFEKIVKLHFDADSEVYWAFFDKMVQRLPRVVANLKSQRVPYKTQCELLKLYYSKYKRYHLFWGTVVPIFLVPNTVFVLVKKIYMKYLV